MSTTLAIEITIIVLLADIAVGGIIILYLGLIHGIDVSSPSALCNTTQMKKSLCILLYTTMLILFLPIFLIFYVNDLIHYVWSKRRNK